MGLTRNQLDNFLLGLGLKIDFSTLDKLDSDNETYVYTFTIHTPEKE